MTIDIFYAGMGLFAAGFIISMWVLIELDLGEVRRAKLMINPLQQQPLPLSPLWSQGINQRDSGIRYRYIDGELYSMPQFTPDQLCRMEQFQAYIGMSREAYLHGARCSICGADSKEKRDERCRGACQG